MRRPSVLLLAIALTAGCSRGRLQPPPSAPAPPAVLSPGSEGKATFFFPVVIPLDEVRKVAEASLPPRLADERKQEISGALQDDFYRYVLERGAVEVGFALDRLTFAFPVKGSLTVGGRLAGLPVRETVEFSGRVAATASPAVTADWRPDPNPGARIALDRADLRIVGPFSVSVRSFLEERLNPILDEELRKAAGRLLQDLALRRRAEDAWKSLHVARRARSGENLWICFQPLEVSLARVEEHGGSLTTGIGIAGRISMALGPSLPPPAAAPLPPLRTDAGKAGGFELDVPVAASPGELSRWVERELVGTRYRVGRDRELEIRSAHLSAAEDRLALALAFRTGGREGVLTLRGRPVVDPGSSVLRLADLQYDLASESFFLRLADRLHRTELLEKLRVSARLDLGPLLAEAERETGAAIQGLFPPGVHGTVRVDPVRILGLGIAGGAVQARCRVTGAITSLPL